MDDFKKVATIDRLSPGRCMSVVVDDQNVALFNVDGVVHALAGNCPHMGGLLGNGTLTGSVVKCPEHGMRFDVTTGTTPGGRGLSVKKFAVKVENADVLISLANANEGEGPSEKPAPPPSEVKPQAGVNPWGSSLDKLAEWDPEGSKHLLRMGTNPWTSGVLPRKEIELICLALHCACTNLDEGGTRRHMRAALVAGATRDEILVVLKMGVGLAVHSCSLGAPILLEEMKSAGVKAAGRPQLETPACDAMRAMGQWNTAWDSFFELSPQWTDDFFAFAVNIYKSGVFTPRFVELLSIAFDASVTHMYAPGTRRHVKGALAAGATPEEIMAVLHLCVSMGVEACAAGLPILAEELERLDREA